MNILVENIFAFSNSKLSLRPTTYNSFVLLRHILAIMAATRVQIEHKPNQLNRRICNLSYTVDEPILPSYRGDRLIAIIELS